MFRYYASLKFESCRLDTYGGWGCSYVDPKELARQGFYYLKKDDHVACVFCSIIIGMWDRGDTPLGEHTRHSPSCPFLLGNVVGNIPMRQCEILYGLNHELRYPFRPDNEIASSSRTRSSGIRGVVTDSHSHGNVTGGFLAESFRQINADANRSNFTDPYDHLGLPGYSSCKITRYRTLDSRIDSFSEWPYHLQKPTPLQLAEAGFYSCKLSDHVVCFHCGQGLRNWEENDNPWIEHVRWYPDCGFIHLHLSKEEIDDIKVRYPPYCKFAVVPELTDEHLELLMELDYTATAIRIGFSRDVVKEVLKRRIRTTNLPFLTQDSCHEAILIYMEEQQRHKPKSAIDKISVGPDMPSSSSGEDVVGGFSSLSAAGTAIRTQQATSSTTEGQQLQQQPVASTEVVVVVAEESPQQSQQQHQQRQPSPSLNTLELGARGTQLDSIDNSKLCKICLDHQLEIVLLPCRHMVTCARCTASQTNCPVCRQQIKYVIKPIVA